MSSRRHSNLPTPRHRSAAGHDRRHAQRYATSGTSGIIGWSEGDEQRTTPATLIDISLGGCAAHVTIFPPTESPVWVRLVSLPSSPWIEASVVATVKRGSFAWTKRLVRLRFVEGCPYDVFKAAIDGFSREVQLPDFEAKGFSIRDWI